MKKRTIIARSDKIQLLVAENPKNLGSAARERFAFYHDGITMGEFLNRGGRREDLRYDEDHGYITKMKPDYVRSQRDVFRGFYQIIKSGESDEDKVCALYAMADANGWVARGSNIHNRTSAQYAKAMWYEAHHETRGWLNELTEKAKGFFPDLPPPPKPYPGSERFGDWAFDGPDQNIVPVEPDKAR